MSRAEFLTGPDARRRLSLALPGDYRWDVPDCGERLADDAIAFVVRRIDARRPAVSYRAIVAVDQPVRLEQITAPV